MALFKRKEKEPRLWVTSQKKVLKCGEAQYKDIHLQKFKFVIGYFLKTDRVLMNACPGFGSSGFLLLPPASLDCGLNYRVLFSR